MNPWERYQKLRKEDPRFATALAAPFVIIAVMLISALLQGVFPQAVATPTTTNWPTLTFLEQETRSAELLVTVTAQLTSPMCVSLTMNLDVTEAGATEMLQTAPTTDNCRTRMARLNLPDGDDADEFLVGYAAGSLSQSGMVVESEEGRGFVVFYNQVVVLRRDFVDGATVYLFFPYSGEEEHGYVAVVALGEREYDPTMSAWMLLQEINPRLAATLEAPFAPPTPEP